MSDPLRIAADSAAGTTRTSCWCTSTAYTPSMPSQIARHYLERRFYCQGAVDVLRKVLGTADEETLG